MDRATSYPLEPHLGVTLQSGREQNRDARKFFVFLIAVSLPLLFYSLWQIGLSVVHLGAHESGDFGIILCGPRSFLLDSQMSPYQKCGRTPLAGFLYPPLSILFLLPLAAMQTGIAFIVQFVLSAALLGVILVALRDLSGEEWPRDRFKHVVLLVLIVSLAPVMLTLLEGHLNIIVLATFVTALVLASKRYNRTAGLIVSIGFWLKLYPAMLGGLFLARRELRPAAFWAVGCALVFAVLGLMVLPLSLYIEYFTVFLPTMQEFSVPGRTQSITGQLLSLQTDLGTHIATGELPFVSRPLPFSLHLLSDAVLMLGGGLALLRMQKGEPDSGRPLEALAILLLTLLLYSPVAWDHHFVLAIPAIAVLLMRLNRGTSRIQQVLIASCWFALTVPVWTSFPQRLLSLPGGSFMAGLFYMRYTLSALCMMGLLIAPRLRDDFALLRLRQ